MMIAELGVFSLLIALMFSLMLAIVPTLGLYRTQHYSEGQGLYSPNRYVYGQCVFVLLAYAFLTLCFYQDDFSVRYVLANSSRTLPWFYKLCAVWGGHEGSMLLWVTILSAWTLAVTVFSRGLDEVMRVRVLIVLGALSAGFLLFLLVTSNPFLRQFQDLTHQQGRDLNPLLQDPGFLFHPPMLYMGYVGFAVAFAFATAALWLGRAESAWAKWTRPWTLAAWCCLTLGITLGSWWAYRELGWGGWWFWDPVENASFMPWLVGTALIHSLIVSEKRQQFKAWTLLLAITAFSLSLVGTFLVRSGVLTSVHAFAVDPARGLFILLFLSVVIGGSLLLFACRAQTVATHDRLDVVSRESSLLLNNVFLFAAMLTVLMGTIYPLLIDGFGLGKLSVGAPYFNTVFVPLMVPFFIIMGVGVHVKWRHDELKRVIFSLRYIVLLSVLFPMVWVGLVFASINLSVLLGLILGVWVALSTAARLFQQIKLKGISGLHRSFHGMILSHVGVAFTVIGIAVSSGYGQQTDVRLSPGEHLRFAGFKIEFVKEVEISGPNYHGTQAQFSVSRAQHRANIYPQKRIYTVGQQAMTESAIDVTPFRDVYIALGEPLGGHSWSIRLYYKPLVRWIWGGGVMICLGGLLALFDRRFYQRA